MVPSGISRVHWPSGFDGLHDVEVDVLLSQQLKASADDVVDRVCAAVVAGTDIAPRATKTLINPAANFILRPSYPYKQRESQERVAPPRGSFREWPGTRLPRTNALATEFFLVLISLWRMGTVVMKPWLRPRC
jgi:hypothetical protein